MKKKLLFLLTLLLVFPIWILAGNVNTLLVLTKDQKQHRFVLSEDKPVVTFEGTVLKITCEKSSSSASFELSDVVRFVYEAIDASGINELISPETNISLEEGVLVISQVKAGETVCVYSMDGRLQQQLKAKRAGTYRLSLSSLPFGVYLVKAGTLTYKITKR